MVKNLPVNAGDIKDVGSIPEFGRFPGGGHDNPFQYSCLRNPMDRGSWQATVHRVLGNTEVLGVSNFTNRSETLTIGELGLREPRSSVCYFCGFYCNSKLLYKVSKAKLAKKLLGLSICSQILIFMLIYLR